MHAPTRAKSTRSCGARRLVRLVAFLGGGILLQTTAGGCQEYLSSFVDALGQPVATGIGNGVSSLLEALVLNLFT
jgi:hypothetical protein